MAHIAYAQVLMSHAFMLRGTGYADTVTSDGWNGLFYYTNLARVELENSKSFSDSNPIWYGTMISVLTVQDKNGEEFGSTVKEAILKEPNYYNTYFSALNYLLPQWHGSKRELSEFINLSVKNPGNAEGLGLYTRLWWSFVSFKMVGNLFEETLVDWSKMKQGFEEITTRFPSAYNFNAYASFACLANDREAFRSIYPRMKDDFISEAWKATPPTPKCLSWAN